MIPYMPARAAGRWSMLRIVPILLMLGALVPPAAAQNAADAEVTCLLPSQVRPLNGQTRYLSARRKVTIPAGECATRGGEVVGSAVVGTPREPAAGRGRMVRIQQTLHELGYDPGPVDGIYGRRTGAAIRRFQQDHGLPVDGRPGDDLLQALQARSAR